VCSDLRFERCCFLALLRVDTQLLQALWKELRLLKLMQLKGKILGKVKSHRKIIKASIFFSKKKGNWGIIHLFLRADSFNTSSGWGVANILASFTSLHHYDWYHYHAYMYVCMYICIVVGRGSVARMTTRWRRFASSPTKLPRIVGRCSG